MTTDQKDARKTIEHSILAMEQQLIGLANMTDTLLQSVKDKIRNEPETVMYYMYLSLQCQLIAIRNMQLAYEMEHDSKGAEPDGHTSEGHS